MTKLPAMHKRIFQQHTNSMGERMSTEFQKFLET